MRVAQFNTFPYGGAATAARRVHKTMCNKEIDSNFYYHRNSKHQITDPTFHQLEFSPPQHGILSRALKRRQYRNQQKETYRLYNEHIASRPSSSETFSMAQLPEPTTLDWKTINADIVHLHWISFFADYSSFFRSIPDAVPIVWTLHDMNAFTGGCHYSNGCGRFKSGCGSCPQVTNSHLNDVSNATFGTKQEALKGKQIHVVTPSDWMRELAIHSKIWPEQTTFQTLRLGFDLETFKPIPKDEAKRRLGIESNAIQIAFGAEDINNRRKGMRHLLKSLAQLKSDTPIECLVFGLGEIETTAEIPEIHQFGYVDSEEKQALIYSAADIVVVPSREDNQPQVGLEAMACGTPVIAFEAGGIPEYVRHGTTGFLARLGDESHLANQIKRLVENDEARQLMGQRARLMMEREFELHQQTDKHVQLYSSVTRSPSRARAA